MPGIFRIIGFSYAATLAGGLIYGGYDNLYSPNDAPTSAAAAGGTVAGCFGGFGNYIRSFDPQSKPLAYVANAVKLVGFTYGGVAFLGAFTGSGALWAGDKLLGLLAVNDLPARVQPSTRSTSLDSADRNLRISYESRPTSINYAAMNVTSRIANLEESVLSSARGATSTPLKLEHNRTYG